METIMFFLDTYFILLYRMTGMPLLDYCIGTFLLAMGTVVIGEFTISLAFTFNRKYIDAANDDLVEKNNLSMEAMQCGDEASYRACNSLANDAFGKVFFSMIALSAAALWPIFFALAWMQHRFIGVEFPLPVTVPLFGDSVGYVFTYFLFYMLARILFKQVKPLLPYFRNMQNLLMAYDGGGRRMITIADIMAKQKNGPAASGPF